MSRAVLRPLLWATAGLAGVATVLATTTRRDSTVSAAAPTAVPAAGITPERVSVPDANPRVEPGKVKWHASFADAQAAAEQSGKPVLLFHMMGQLDRQFC